MSVSVREALQDHQCYGCHLDQILTCSICDKKYEDPIQFPCQHCFCKAPCFKGLLKGLEPGDWVQCPQCNNKHTVPEEGLEGFPSSDMVNKLLKVSKKEYSEFARKSHDRQRAEAKGFRPAYENKITALRRKRNVQALLKRREEEEREKALSEKTADDDEGTTEPVSTLNGSESVCRPRQDSTCSDGTFLASNDEGSIKDDAERSGQQTKTKRKRQRKKSKQKRLSATPLENNALVPVGIGKDTITNDNSALIAHIDKIVAESKDLYHIPNYDEVERDDSKPLPRCPECHQRPIQQNCLHCYKDICIPCLEGHMKPIVSAAAEIFREQRRQAEESASRKAIELPESNEKSDEKKDDEVKEKGEVIANETFQVRDANNVPVMIRIRARVHNDDPEDMEEAIKNHFRAKQEQTRKVIRIYSHILDPDEIRMMTFISEYVATKLIPYRQCCLARLYFKRHLDDFKEFCEGRLNRSLKHLTVKDMIILQKYCQMFLCVFKELQAGLVKPPPKIKLIKDKTTILQAKLLYTNDEGLNVHGFFERKIKHLHAIKISPFVERTECNDNEENCSFTVYPRTSDIHFEDDNLGDNGSIKVESRLKTNFCYMYLKLRREFCDLVLTSDKLPTGDKYELSKQSETPAAVHKATRKLVKKLPKGSDIITEDECEMLPGLPLAVEWLRQWPSTGNINYIEQIEFDDELLDKALRKLDQLLSNSDSNLEKKFRQGAKLPFSLIPDRKLLEAYISTAPADDVSRHGSLTAWADPGDANYVAYTDRTKLDKIKKSMLVSQQEIDTLLWIRQFPTDDNKTVYLFPDRLSGGTAGPVGHFSDLLLRLRVLQREANEEASPDHPNPEAENYRLITKAVNRFLSEKFVMPSFERELNVSRMIEPKERLVEVESSSEASGKTEIKQMEEGPGGARAREPSGSSDNIVLDRPEDPITMDEFLKFIDEVD